MTTLTDFLHEYPVTPISLYKPDPRDWFKDVMLYLNRVNDCRRRVWQLRSRAALLDSIEEPDEELLSYRDEVHQKLDQAEQDMKRVRLEVMELIGQLDSEEQETVITRKYIEWQSWKQIAWAMDQPVKTVHTHHAKALPKLKRILVEQGLIPDTYISRKQRAEGKAEHVFDGEQVDGEQIDEQQMNIGSGLHDSDAAQVDIVSNADD